MKKISVRAARSVIGAPGRGIVLFGSMNGICVTVAWRIPSGVSTVQSVVRAIDFHKGQRDVLF